jgi:hypothetical protein
MDCQKLDQHVIDALYGELDELTHVALKRHIEGCARCAGVLSGLRATREVGALPLEEPSDDLEARILDAAVAAQRKAPWPRKVLRGLAWAGSHAMRPQLAMAALFFLVIGSSMLLLRAKPGTVGVPVRVTENGAPSPEVREPAAEPLAAATATPHPAEPLAAAEAPLFAEARGREPSSKDLSEIDEKKAKGERQAKVSAKLDEGDMAATAGAMPAPGVMPAPGAADAPGTTNTPDASGCPAAISALEALRARAPGTRATADATWAAATCYRSMGATAKARELYTALRADGDYRERAEQQLASLPEPQQQLAARAAVERPAAASPRSSAAEAKPRNTDSFGSSGKANAAPKAAAPSAY